MIRRVPPRHRAFRFGRAWPAAPAAGCPSSDDATMKTDDDLILFLTRTLRELEPAVRPDVVGRLEERMRSHFGGERVYVAKPADRRVALRQARVLARLRTGESVRDVARAMSLSVRTVYRIKLRLPER